MSHLLDKLVVFTTIYFLFFLFAVLIGLFMAPRRLRWIMLLFASAFFYSCWSYKHLLLILAGTVIEYWVVQNMMRHPIGRARYGWLSVGLAIEIGTLVFFKYTRFIFGGVIGLSYILAPLGLSYIFFKRVSFLVDSYRGNFRQKIGLGHFITYVIFFPTVVSGPIDRPKPLLNQIALASNFTSDAIAMGARRFLWGLFKKVVIADNLAQFTRAAFASPFEYQGIGLVLAMLIYSVRLYADFSGYTDMAIGIARMLGYEVGENFNSPYFANSIGDFWKRWHMTLASWLREYIFLPIAYSLSRRIDTDIWFGIKNESWSYIIATILTMLLCGLWHGAGWNFVLWGGLNGVWLSLSFSTRRQRARARRKLVPFFLLPLWQFIRVGITFLGVSMLWTFFRTETLREAISFLKHLILPFPASCRAMVLDGNLSATLFLGNSYLLVVFCFFCVGVLIVEHIFLKRISKWLASLTWPVRIVLYVILLLLTLNLGAGQQQQFIYFQF